MPITFKQLPSPCGIVNWSLHRSFVKWITLRLLSECRCCKRCIGLLPCGVRGDISFNPRLIACRLQGKSLFSGEMRKDSRLLSSRQKRARERPLHHQVERALRERLGSGFRMVRAKSLCFNFSQPQGILAAQKQRGGCRAQPQGLRPLPLLLRGLARGPAMPLAVGYAWFWNGGSG